MNLLTVSRRGFGPAVSGLWPLAAVAGVAMVLAATGVLPRWPGLVHVVALPPADFFMDLRVLLARAHTAPLFVLEVLAVLAVRVLVLGGFLDVAQRGEDGLALLTVTLFGLLLLPGVDFRIIEE
jgi:hypothetical protein